MTRIPDHAEKVFAGVLFDVYQWQQELFDGSTATFEMLKRVNASVVVGITPDHQILLIDDEQPGRPAHLTFPGGHIDPQEDPLDAAKRELMEETGYSSTEWELWKAYQLDTKVECTFHYYIARNITLTGKPQLDQGGEIIRPRLVPIEEFLEGIISGKQRAYDFGSDIMRQLLQGKRDELISFLTHGKN